MAFAARTFARPRRLAVAVPGWMRIGVGAWLATRLAIGAGLTGAYLISAYTKFPVSLNRFDSIWYVDIAQHGYTAGASPNFFPLLPMLMSGIGRVIAGGREPSQTDLLVAGLGVSAIATLVAFCVMAALIELEADARTAAAAVRLVAAYPLAFFLAAAYTDGPFLAAALVFFFGIRTRRWSVAALAGLVAGLARPVAPVLTIAVLGELALELAMRRTDREPIKGRLFASAGPLIGTGLYAAFLWLRFGDPLLFVHTETHYWKHVATWPWQTLLYMSERMAHPGVMISLDFGLVLAFGALAVVMLTRLRPAYGLMTAGLVLAILVSPTPSHKDAVQSAGRYLLAAFPAFWMAARWVVDRPWAEFALIAAGLPLQATLAVLFVLGGQIY